MSKMVYIKTDKNGTKYWADYTCQRCGGAGGSDKWALTGWTCYECGGSGESSKPTTWKEYTPEYQAKLDERRRKRDEARREKNIAEFESKLPELYKQRGADEQGNIFVVLGNTYPIKDELKSKGAKFDTLFGWYFAQDMEGYETVKIEDCFNKYPANNSIGWKPEVYDKVKEAKTKKVEKESTSQYVGEIGERLDLDVTYTDYHSFERAPMRGYGSDRTETVGIYKFEDKDGNVLVWTTTTWVVVKKGEHYRDIEIGDKFHLRGTVSNHKVYREEMQTELKRCKVELLEG